MAPARKYWRYVRQIYDRSDSTSRVACYIRAAARNSIQPRCLCLINYYGQYANRMQIARHRARCASRVGGEKSTKERKRRKRKRRRKKEREREREEKTWTGNLALIAQRSRSSLCLPRKKFFDLHILPGDFVFKVVLLPLEKVDPLMILVQNGLHASC